MALPEHKIMAIIEKEKYITLKPGNKDLERRLRKMCEKGLIEFADKFRDYEYYRKVGSDWRFYSPDDRRY